MTVSIGNLFLFLEGEVGVGFFGWAQRRGGYVLIFVCSFLLGAGADFVMMGGMFAGHDQSGKECLIITDDIP